MIPVPIDTFELDTTVAIIYTAKYPVRLTDVLLSNRTASQIAFTLHVVPPGGSAADSNKIFPAVQIDGNDVRPFSHNVILNGKDYTLQAFASGAGLNFTGTLAFTG